MSIQSLFLVPRHKKADLVTITAKSYTREYGEDNPTFDFTVEGATLDGTPEIICEATATSPVGTYDILIKQGTTTSPTWLVR